MKKEETLRQIKETEKEARRGREAASVERERILREARREAFELREALRKEAEARYEEILKEAEASAAHEKATVLAAGQRDADALAVEAGAHIDRAVEFVIGKFKGALNA